MVQGHAVGMNDQGMGAAGVGSGTMVVAGGGGKAIGDGPGGHGVLDGGVEGLLELVAAGKGGGEGADDVEMFTRGIVGVGVDGEAPAGPGMGRMPSLIANHGFQVCFGFGVFVGGWEWNRGWGECRWLGR